MDRHTRVERVLRDEAMWPSPLSDLKNPPAGIRYQGVLPIDWSCAVAIVGTRAATDESMQFTRRLAFELASSGVVIVSGGAFGIDAAAHRGALDASGVTAVVLAGSLNDPYPRQHGDLFAEVIAKGGVLLTEEESGGPGEGDARSRLRAWSFLKRNRLVAALGQAALVLVEAPERSGALSTVAHAKLLKRCIFSVPHSPWDPRGAGSNLVLRQGAQVCTSARSILSVPILSERLGPFEDRKNVEKKRIINDLRRNRGERPPAWWISLDPDERAVVTGLGARTMHVDELATQLGMRPAGIQSVLARLGIRGIVRTSDDGRYALY